MRKKLLRTTAVMLCLAMLCSISAYAAEGRASEQIRYCSASLGKKSNGDLSLTISVTATDTMDTLGASSVVIKRYNGSKWVEEYTYTVQNTPTLQTSNTNLYKFTLTHTPDCSDSEYYAVATFYAKGSAGISTDTVTTSSVTT